MPKPLTKGMPFANYNPAVLKWMSGKVLATDFTDEHGFFKSNL